MGTKNNPGEYDCYKNAEPDEPMFVLLARDIRAPYVVEAWCALAEMKGSDPKKIAEARECAEKMRERRKAQRKESDPAEMKFTICEPVPFDLTSSGPVPCRKGTGNRSSFQGQPVSRCDGAIVVPEGKLPFSLACPKCKLLHVFATLKGKAVYGPAL